MDVIGDVLRSFNKQGLFDFQKVISLLREGDVNGAENMLSQRIGQVSKLSTTGMSVIDNQPSLPDYLSLNMMINLYLGDEAAAKRRAKQIAALLKRPDDFSTKFDRRAMG